MALKYLGSQLEETLLRIRKKPPVGLVIRQQDAVDWAYVLCDRHIHK
jgi:hypothetical protein